MNNFFKVIVGLVIIFVLGIIIPRFFFYDKVQLESEFRDEVFSQTSLLLNNPFERLVIIKTVIMSKSGDKIYIAAYTMFGLPYAKVELTCKKDSSGVDCGTRRL